MLFMSIFQWFKKKKAVENQSVITDEMRQRALEVRRQQHELEQLRKQAEIKSQMDSLKGIIDGGNSKSSQSEDMLLMLLMNMFVNPQQKNSPNQAITGFVNNSPTNPQNSVIARYLADKIPENIVGQIQNTSDTDLIDIKNQVLKLKAGV